DRCAASAPGPAQEHSGADSASLQGGPGARRPDLHNLDAANRYTPDVRRIHPDWQPQEHSLDIRSADAASGTPAGRLAPAAPSARKRRPDKPAVHHSRENHSADAVCTAAVAPAGTAARP